jgi:DNA-binding SARP family transcriptional activator
MPAATSTSSLPRPLVPRPRLITAIEPARIVVVEAAGGFGKSTLAREAGRVLGRTRVDVCLAPRDADPRFLAQRLARALRRAGLTDAGAQAQQALPDPAAVMDAVADALADEPEPTVLALDDVHHAGEEAGELIARLAADMPPEHRLWLLGRHLPPSLEHLRRLPDTVVLTGRDLAFTADETAKLLAAVETGGSRHDAEALARATGGWAVALVVAAGSLGHEQDAAQMARLAETPALLGALLDDGLRRLENEDRRAVLQLAHLPALTPAVAADVTGRPDVLGAAARAGLPFAPERDGRWGMPEPVRDHLVGLAPLDPAVARAAAAEHVRLGEPALGLELLATVDDRAAAALLAGLSPAQVERLDVLELSTIVTGLSPSARAAHPLVLVHLARACEPAAQVQRRSEALSRALELARDTDPALVREVEAELARDLARDARPEEAETLAARVLAEAGAGELPTRARALDVLGRVKAWRRDPASLAEAEPLLEEAYRLCLALGCRSWAAQVVMPLAIHVHYARGHHARAVERIDDALAGLPGRSRHRAVMLVFRADVLIDCGRFAEAESSLAEAREIAERLRDARALAYAAWSEARIAAYREDAGGTLEALRRAESHHGDWFEHDTGAELLADAAELLGLVDEPEPAWTYLERAEARLPQAEWAARFSRATLTARHGDPAEAEERLSALAAEPRLEPRDRWRVALLRALAAARRGDPEAARLTEDAFSLAAEIDGEALPFVRERAVAERLRGGGDAAVPAVTVLGRFEVARPSGTLALPPGLPTQLVKLLACAGGRLPSDAVVESLWPETEPASGRKRLRNVLNRLRESAGELVVREFEMLALAPGVEVDAVAFEREALQALAARDAGAARASLGRYGGELLPDDRYAPWAAEPRERLARRHLALVDLLADRAEAEGEVDETLRWLERGIAADPLDESRYLRSAHLLLAQGRRGRALDVLRAAAAALRDLDLEPSDEHRALVRAART